MPDREPPRAPPPIPGGALEDAVLQWLWTHGPATVRQVHDAVGLPRGIAYTTVGRVLDRLADKGLLLRSRQGRRNRYATAWERRAVVQASIRSRLGELLRGDPAPAAAALLGAVGEIDAALLDELATLVEARRKGGTDGT